MNSKNSLIKKNVGLYYCDKQSSGVKLVEKRILSVSGFSRAKLTPLTFRCTENESGQNMIGLSNHFDFDLSCTTIMQNVTF